MRIVALNSSARKGGNTEKILRLLEQQLKAQDPGLTFEYISLAGENLALCRGCRLCFDKGETACPLKDSLPAVCQKLLAADGVVFASPVYVEDVNGIMKNFLDRMAWSNHRPSFAGKTALILTTSGMGSSNHALRTIKFAVSAWGFHVSAVHKFRMGALMDDGSTAQKFSAQTATLAGKLLNDIVSRAPLKPSLMSLVVFKVQQKCWQAEKRAVDSFDYHFWLNSGWLEHSQSFYIEHRAGPAKTLLAKGLGSFIALFFK